MTATEQTSVSKTNIPELQHYIDFANVSEKHVTELLIDIQNNNNGKQKDDKKSTRSSTAENDVISLSSEETECTTKSKRLNLSSNPRGGVYDPFPVKLYQMLVASEVVGFQNLISWRSHGRCFKVHNPEAFAKSILPVYTRQTNIRSFSRQLNLYGFRRCSRDADDGSYYHEKFLRGKALLVRTILRTKVKGPNRLNSAEPLEPDFYKDYPPLPPLCSVGRDSKKGRNLLTKKDQFRSVHVRPKRGRSCDESSDLSSAMREEKRSRLGSSAGLPIYPYDMLHDARYPILSQMRQIMPVLPPSILDYVSYNGRSPLHGDQRYPLPPHHYESDLEALLMRRRSEGTITSSNHKMSLPRQGNVEDPLPVAPFPSNTELLELACSILEDQVRREDSYRMFLDSLKHQQDRIFR